MQNSHLLSNIVVKIAIFWDIALLIAQVTQYACYYDNETCEGTWLERERQEINTEFTQGDILMDAH
jgi:hypothetical protein